MLTFKNFLFENATYDHRMDGVLAKARDQNKIDLTDGDKNNLKNFSHNYASSHGLNSTLVKNYHDDNHPEFGLSEKDKSMHNTLKKVTNHPINARVKVYSGLGFDPDKGAMIGNKLYSPAHLSTSHSHDTAYEYAASAADYNDDGVRHIASIQLEPHNKGYHVGPIDDWNEHETVLPAGTTLRRTHVTREKDDEGEIVTHHFVVHDQN